MARLRDVALPLLGAALMDINYILSREQVSLHNALVATSAPARLSHEGMAAAYGRLLAEGGFPHRTATRLSLTSSSSSKDERRKDGGSTTGTNVDSIALSLRAIGPVGTAMAQPDAITQKEKL